MRTNLAANGSPFVHVVGPDIDRELITTLHIGDHVLVECNGKRLYTDNHLTILGK